VYFSSRRKIMTFHLGDEVIELFKEEEDSEEMSILAKPFGEAARILKYDSFDKMMEDIKDSIEYKHDYAITITGFYTDEDKTLTLDQETIVDYDMEIYIEALG
jgi:hypothetical protein